jgi:hypothetical protein
VGLMGKLRRLERGAREDLGSFILEDGSRYYYNPESGECFLHACACIRAGYEGEPFPEPPQTIKALTRARNKGTQQGRRTGYSLWWWRSFARSVPV